MPPAKSSARPNPPAPRRNAPLEVVDPIWLLKAIGLCIVAALVCAYATLCLLFYQGEWQLVLHPSHTIDRTPASTGLAYNDIHFGASETGQPSLTGWWVPAGSQGGFQSRYAAFTVLYLHDGSGSLSNSVTTITLLHNAGLNVFAIDYRGFGASDSSVHPSEARMSQDTAAALEYLTSTRHIPTTNIIPYGAGLGASLAANLARAHSEFPAVVLDNPAPDPASTAIAARPSRLVPVRLLFGDQFNVMKPIAALAIPKLLIAGGPGSNSPTRDPIPLQSLFKKAASPSFSVTLPPALFESAYHAALNRFLDQYLPAQLPGQ